MAFGLGSLLGIGAAVQTVGTLYGISTARSESKRAATQERERSAREAELLKRDARRLAGEQRVRMAQSGIDLSDGSAFALIDETNRLSAEDVAHILQYGDQRSSSIQRSGRNAVIGGIFNLGSLGVSTAYTYTNYKKSGAL